MELQLNCGNVLPPETAADLLSSTLSKKKDKKVKLGHIVGCVHVNTYFFCLFLLSDMRNGHGAWNILTVSSLTRREWCHHPWGPVNAAALRAWRLEHGALHTVVTLTPIGRGCSTGTPSTRWETLRTATGGDQTCVADMALGLSWIFWEVSSLCWFSLSLERPVRALWETQWKLTHSRHDDEIR